MTLYLNVWISFFCHETGLRTWIQQPTSRMYFTPWIGNYHVSTEHLWTWRSDILTCWPLALQVSHEAFTVTFCRKMQMMTFGNLLESVHFNFSQITNNYYLNESITPAIRQLTVLTLNVTVWNLEWVAPFTQFYVHIHVHYRPIKRFHIFGPGAKKKEIPKLKFI